MTMTTKTGERDEARESDEVKMARESDEAEMARGRESERERESRSRDDVEGFTKQPAPNRLRRVVSSAAFPAGRIVLVVAAAVDAVMFPMFVTVASVAATLRGV
ncbi:hypothetical protein DY000_02030178 [Brassica cretica]|uniref:Uncharacterized protein n=1 Tax=Brassica cretica TaxID=69181 RepID=A0ABQ7DGR1_BRACR|nr:hypothetical protein DY000_02030178 [Brassica cretica]